MEDQRTKSKLRIEHFEKGDVCCRNFFPMYWYLIKELNWSEKQADLLFEPYLADSMVFYESEFGTKKRQMVLADIKTKDSSEVWVDHVTYDQIVRNTIVSSFGRGILEKIGKISGKLEPKGLSEKIRNVAGAGGISVRRIYEGIIPLMVRLYNTTKEFVLLRSGATSCTYMIDLNGGVDPFADWTSDLWIRGILSEAPTELDLPHAKVIARVLPYNIVVLLTEEFAELNLKVELRDNFLYVNEAVCGREVILNEVISPVTMGSYFDGTFVEITPENENDSSLTRGVVITQVITAMKSVTDNWCAVKKDEVYVSGSDFEVNPYYILDITWKKLPLYKAFPYFLLGILIKIIFASRAREVEAALEKSRLQNRDPRTLVREQTIALKAVNAQLAEANAKLEEANIEIRTLFSHLFPSSFMAKLMIENGEIPPRSRMVGILYIDIAGSTKATEEDGAEVWMKKVAVFYDIVESVLEKFEGARYQLIGDEVLGYWIPNLTTKKDIDIADCMINAALELRRRLKDFPHKIRIGLDIGNIVIGTVGSRHPTIQGFGSPLNTGARHIGKAEIGEIVFGRRLMKMLPSETKKVLEALGLYVQEKVFLKGLGERDLYHVPAEEE